MQADDPVQAMQLRKQHILAPVDGKKNYGAIVDVVKTVSRSAEMSSKCKLREYNLRQFYKRFRAEDYTDPQIEEKWVKKTSALAFQKGMAEKRGKKTWVWLPEPRTIAKKDVLAVHLTGPAEQLRMGESSAKEMLLGKHAPRIGSGKTFGLVGKNLGDTEGRCSDSDESGDERPPPTASVVAPPAKKRKKDKKDDDNDEGAVGGGAGGSDDSSSDSSDSSSSSSQPKKKHKSHVTPSKGTLIIIIIISFLIIIFDC